MNKLIIAGDIGGTKTLLQLLETDGDQCKVMLSHRYSSLEYADFDSLLTDFTRRAQLLMSNREIVAMCLGIAGPIASRVARVTNINWSLHADALQKQFAIAHVELINDFAAVGYGIDRLKPHDLRCLQAGVSVEKATRVVIGAGTGLGEGYLVWCDGQYVPFPSEGGHVDYAPQNKTQIELLLYLQARFGHVSYERIVSGMGLINVFEFLASTQQPIAALQQALANGGDKAAIITAYALDQKDSVAVQALDIFIASYGAQTGNLALTCLARGGVYIAGGIAPKIIDRMTRGDFLRSFCDKGRFTPLMESLPVNVVVNPEVGLYGAGRVAMKFV